MLKIIFGCLCLFLNNVEIAANHFYPIVPDCVVNYTSFLGKYADPTQVELLYNFSDISGDKCGEYCNEYNACTSFNFFPSSFFYWNSASRCELIINNFNSSFLETKENVGFYLKSINDCSTERTVEIYQYLIIAIVGFFIIVLISWCLCSKRTRNQYSRLN